MVTVEVDIVGESHDESWSRGSTGDSGLKGTVVANGRGSGNFSSSLPELTILVLSNLWCQLVLT